MNSDGSPHDATEGADFIDGVLRSIDGPADLRRLTYAQLDDLCGEIRDFIVGAVSENAGHLGSNLGAVELTLALHRVFESPTDAILWDTGHQAYVHKIRARLRREQPCIDDPVVRLRDGRRPRCGHRSASTHRRGDR